MKRNRMARDHTRVKAVWQMAAVLTCGLLYSTPALAGLVQDKAEGRLVQGSAGMMFGAKVTTWARLAADGSVLAAGANVPMSLIENVPDMPAGMDAMTGPPPGYKPFALDFPAAVKATTFLDHVDLGWVPAGHPPVYMLPHFDLHFFTISARDVEAIDCKDLTQASPPLLAPGYVPAVPPNQQAADICVPFMGFHSLPLEDMAPGMKFEKTMIAVYYSGRLNAIEPMVTRETLMKKQSFSLPVPAVESIGKVTRYPTKFEAVFDKAANSYALIFSNFVMKRR